MNEYRFEDAALGGLTPHLLPDLEALLRDLPSKSVVADAGCGNGSLLAQLLPCEWELHGLDSSTTGLAQAREAYPRIAFSHADLTVDMGEHPLAEMCDVVICTEVVEHVFLPRRLARNCWTLLKPGGRLIITTPYHGYLKDLLIAACGRTDQQYTALWDYGHIKFWSRKTLTALLLEAGFVVTDFRGVGRNLPYLWKSMLLVATKR